MQKLRVYDAFGNEKAPDPTDTNPFRYCGEYWDQETGTYYLRARHYAPRLGRFTQEDSARDGQNWYIYCDSNPIKYVDSNGREKIIVSGGAYSDKDGYQYEFIDSALREASSYKGKEKVSLLIADVGISQADKDKIASYGIEPIYFTDTSTINKYINNGSDNNRADDPITSFRVFAHGYSSNDGSIEFGHGVSSADKEALSWTKDKITDSQTGLNSSAFSKTNSVFYSCNTGTAGTDSFAQSWSNITGGKTKAAIGQTSYNSINAPRWYNWDMWAGYKIGREMTGGYSTPNRAFNAPGLKSGAKWNTFKPQSSN